MRATSHQKKEKKSRAQVQEAPGSAEGQTGKRMAITYDVINEIGKVTMANTKLNRVIVDDSVLKAVDTLELFAKSSVNEAISE